MKAKLILENGESRELEILSFQHRCDSLPVYGKGYDTVPRYISLGPSIVEIRAIVLEPERVELPRTTRDRFTLASLLPVHDYLCDCPACFFSEGSED